MVVTTSDSKVFQHIGSVPTIPGILDQLVESNSMVHERALPLRRAHGCRGPMLAPTHAAAAKESHPTHHPT